MVNFIFPILVGVFTIALIVIALVPGIKLTNEQYDRLKWLSDKWELFVVFLGVITKAFDLPYAIATVTIFAGIGALLGGLLMKSNKDYKSNFPIEEDGDVDYTDIEEDEDEVDEDELIDKE